MKRLAIAFFYDKDGIIDDYMFLLTNEMAEFAERTIFVSNGPLNTDCANRLKPLVQHILIRENEGFDVWAYKAALEYVGYESLAEYDEIILYNHTFYGPFFPFSEMFAEMERRDCSFWGITAHKRMEPNPFTGSGFLPFHLNSHFIAVRRDMASSAEFRRFWESMPPITSYQDSILLHESRFVMHFTDIGFQVSTYIDPEQYTSNYPLFEEVDEVIKNRCPIMKRRSFFSDPAAMDQMAIDLPRALRLLQQHSTYDIDLIWRNILRETNLRVLHTNVSLFRILPDTRLQTNKRPYGSLAVCIHIYYIEMLQELVALCRNIQHKFDFIATTDTQEKKQTIVSFLVKEKHNNLQQIENIIVRVVDKNIGADTSALLITCSDLMQPGKYDLVCRLHSKKSKQDIGGRGRYFKNHLFENLVNSAGYVDNVLDMFAETPIIGLAIPPVIHVYYPTMGHGWFTNRSQTENIAAKIGIKVRFDEDTPIAPYGSMFWFRPAALRKLFEYPWTWKDFEGDISYGDGDVPHAIERIYAYVAQDAGFLTQTIASLRQAEQSYVRLEYKVQKFASFIPAGDFAYHCFLLSKWKNAGHPLIEAEKNPRPDALAIQRKSPWSAKAVSRLQRRIKWRRGIIAHIDQINEQGVNERLDFCFDRSDCVALTIVGWAIPTGSNEAFESVSIRLIGNNDSFSAPAKLVRRPDIADHFGQRNFERAGIEWRSPIQSISVGKYNVQIVGTDKDGADISTSVGTISLR